ncbi:MAG: photosystem II assembly protein Psb34 [Xenococcaceae cyanobacterium]
MPYTEEDGGRLNNFAVEPKMYKAEPPNKNQQRNFVILGVVGFFLVGGLIAVAVFASSAT